MGIAVQPQSAVRCIVTKAIVYHGTPLTPRSALLEVCTGRAMCVSFFRPDDVEVVEAISPTIMFRQWRVFILEGSYTQWAGMGRNTSRLDAIFRVARISLISSWSMGSHPRYSGCAKPAQRCATKRVAVWAERCAAMAYGRANREAFTSVRQVRPRVFGMDRSRQALRQSRVSCTHGRSGAGFGESMAGFAHDARHASCV